MTELATEDPHAWNGAPPTIFVDSNVINEVYTLVDLSRIWSSFELSGGLINPESRRLRARGTLWLAMVLDDEHRVTVSLKHEPFLFAKNNAPPQSWDGGWVTIFLYFVNDYVFPNWITTAIDKQAGGRGANDTAIAEESSARKIPLITRDAGLRKKAERRDVKVYTPEEYCLGRMSLDAARRRFFERFDANAMAYAFKSAALGEDFMEDLKIDCRNLEIVRRLYAYIWADTGNDWDVPGGEPRWSF